MRPAAHMLRVHDLLWPTPKTPVAPSAGPSLMQMPNELLFDIFKRMGVADLTQLEQVNHACRALVAPLWPQAYGLGPTHQALPSCPKTADYKRLAQHKDTIVRKHAQSRQHGTSLGHFDNLYALHILVHGHYAHATPTACQTFAAEALCAMQTHDASGTPLWHQACAQLLMMQARYGEAAVHYDAYVQTQGALPDKTWLLAARYGWPMPYPLPDWSDLPPTERGEALKAAIAGHDIDLAKLLLAGMPPGALHFHVCSHAAAIAARHNNMAAMGLLLAAGADLVRGPIWRAGDTQAHCAPIAEAAYLGHANMVAYLLAQGASGDDLGDARLGASALDYAITQNHAAIVDMLMAHTPRAQRAFPNQSLRLGRLLHADRAPAGQHTDMLAHLVTRWGLPINASDHTGQTFLHQAAECNDLTLVKAALALGADPARRDACGQTPLECAYNRNASAVIAHLRTLAAQPGSHALCYPIKSQLAHDLLLRMGDEQEQVIAEYAAQWHMQMAPARYVLCAIDAPESAWFVQARRHLYMRSLSAESLRAWLAQDTARPVIAWAHQLTYILRLVQLGASPAGATPLAPETRNRIAALCRTFVCPTQMLTMAHRSAFAYAVAHHFTPTQVTELFVFAHTSVGKALAASFRHKFTPETQLWNTFVLGMQA